MLVHYSNWWYLHSRTECITGDSANLYMSIETPARILCFVPCDSTHKTLVCQQTKWSPCSWDLPAIISPSKQHRRPLPVITNCNLGEITYRRKSLANVISRPKIVENNGAHTMLSRPVKHSPGRLSRHLVPGQIPCLRGGVPYYFPSYTAFTTLLCGSTAVIRPALSCMRPALYAGEFVQKCSPSNRPAGSDPGHWYSCTLWAV